jgi:cytochrome bd-type quinol oxidase subunit 2
MMTDNLTAFIILIIIIVMIELLIAGLIYLYCILEEKNSKKWKNEYGEVFYDAINLEKRGGV